MGCQINYLFAEVKGLLYRGLGWPAGMVKKLNKFEVQKPTILSLQIMSKGQQCPIQEGIINLNAQVTESASLYCCWMTELIFEVN